LTNFITDLHLLQAVRTNDFRSAAISSHANDNNFMCTIQHELRKKKRSCKTQWLETINDLARGLDAGYVVDILFLDFSKPFDQLSHSNCLYHTMESL